VTTSVESELTLHRWRSRPLLGVAIVLFAVGFAQFGPSAILADVADHFGEQGPGDSVAEQAGLSGTVLGVGLAVVRIASLGALVLAAAADRIGRRRTALWWATLGLSVTIAAAAAPGYWVLVAALALARPLLSATNTVAQVLAAELTPSTDRAMALAVCTAAYEAIRTVESGRPSVLVAVSGTSAAFDATGRRLAWLPSDRTGVLRVDLPVGPIDTPYVRWGDWVPLGSLVVVLAWLAACVVPVSRERARR
jgi:MFS family permease